MRADLVSKLCMRVAITIPDNTGTGNTFRALALAAGATLPIECTFSIDKNIPGVAGTARAAFVVATPRPATAIATTDFTTHGQFIASGANYDSTQSGDIENYVRANAGSTITALLIASY